MSATSQPFGFTPVWHPSGIIRKASLLNGIASAYGTAIYQGQPVTLNTDGTLTAGGSTGNITGIFAGCVYTQAAGFAPTISNYWPAAQTYVASAGPMWAYYYEDPAIWYAVQADGSLAAASVGDQADYTNPTANTVGYSTCTLSSTLKGAGTQGQFSIRQLSNAPNNAWGDAYTQVIVQIAQHSFVADKTAI